MPAALDKKKMITRRESASQPPWQVALAQAITDPAELLEVLHLDPALLPAARRATARFGLRAPRGFVARMRAGDARDPLLRQILPLGAELVETAGYGSDPVGDAAAETGPGVLRKYHGRALLIACGACVVNCRYCFRREFPYRGHVANGRAWATARDALAADPTINEVILSGGDPLMLSNSRLRELTDGLRSVPHLVRFRVHSRVPVALPERVDAGLCDWLSSLPWPIAVVLHANHAREIDADVVAALERLRGSGATLLNQSVLLAGVNDTVPALAELSETLFAAGVVPYYLHMLDRVRGTAHFEVPEDQARQLMDELTATLPGYLVPRLVREVPGAARKEALYPLGDWAPAEAVRPPSPL